MSDSFQNPQKDEGSHRGNYASGKSGFKGGKSYGNREGGGFRIRLSENEMRAARSIQEAFQLRSTVAVLGFAVRTVGQMLEEGKLEEIKANYHVQGSGGDRRQYSSTNHGGNDFDRNSNRSSHEKRNSQPNPFERPDKPITKEQEPAQESNEESIEDKKEPNVSEEINNESPSEQAEKSANPESI